MTDPFAGLNGSFAPQLHALINAVDAQGGHLDIASGFRDSSQQQQLYNSAVQRYGQAQATNWAAKPGTSNHERGLAADIHGDDKSMKLAHDLAGQFGLNFPLSNEAWHVEPIGVSQMHNNNGGPAAVTDGGTNTAMSRVSALLNAITGGQSGLMGTGSYSSPDQATSMDHYSGASLGATSYDDMFQQAGAKYGISPALLKAVAKQESGFDPNATSGAGAQGIMQFMPGTAKSNGVNPLDPASAIDGAAKMLSGYIKQYGSPELALAAYNAGPGAVQKYGGIPPYAETQSYVRNIMGSVN